MSQHNPPIHRHSLATRMFHHGGIIMLIALWALIELSGDDNTFVVYHKALGVVFLLWTIARLVYALVRPKHTNINQPAWQMAVAFVVHFGLYAAMLFMATVGVLMSVYSGIPVSVFGLFEIPVFVVPNRELASFYNHLHTEIAFPILLGFIGVHILAALYHHFILKDGILSKMR